MDQQLDSKRRIGEIPEDIADPGDHPRLRLRSVGRPEVDLAHRIGRAMVWRVEETAGSVWREFMVARSAWAGPAPSRSGVGYELHTGVGRLLLPDLSLLHLGSGIALDPAQRDDEFEDLGRLACALMDADLASMLGGIRHLRRAGSDAPLGDGVSMPAVELLLTLVGAERGDRHGLMLSAEPTTLLRLFEDLRWQPRVDAGRAPEDLPMTGVVPLGHSRLPAATVRSLRSGDAVFIECAFRDGEGGGVLRFGPLITPLRPRGVMTLTCGPFLRNTMSDDEDRPAPRIPTPQEAAVAPADVDDLPVTLGFEAGRVTLPLGTLRRLAAGDVIELHRPASATVEVTANGMLLGRGELIEVDGRLAVELTSLAAR